MANQPYFYIIFVILHTKKQKKHGYMTNLAQFRKTQKFKSNYYEL